MLFLFLFNSLGCGAGKPNHGPGLEEDAGPEEDSCETWTPDGRRACVPEGPFWYGWSVDRCAPGCIDPSMEGYAAREVVLSAAFLIDLREVSIADYAAFISESGRSPPPVVCDVVYPLLTDCQDSFTTGWSERGEPPAERLEQPVTCVTKEEAQAYCASHGGRLPLSTEWMKSARGPSPNLREAPWAEDTPLGYDGDVGRAYDLIRERLVAWQPESCPDYYGSLVQVQPESVSSRPENASPYGLLHLLGNAAEWVEVAPLGDWYDTGRLDVFGAAYGTNAWSTQVQISAGSPGWNELGNPYGETSRERTLGFRCAYDLPD
jgi:formylglycine-generating enzyme required for sulfatase activity